jgi:hypothetical protein
VMSRRKAVSTTQRIMTHPTGTKDKGATGQHHHLFSVTLREVFCVTLQTTFQYCC